MEMAGFSKLAGVLRDSQLLAVGSRGAYDMEGGEFPETYHSGWALLLEDCDGQEKVVFQTRGADSAASFFRSASKPFQAYAWLHGLKALSLESAQALLPEELAIICSSHSATPEQTGWVEHLLKRFLAPGESAESVLLCGPQKPLRQKDDNKPKLVSPIATRLCNNCSGKHAGMLWACHCAGWDKTTYLQADHPIQKRMIKLLAQYGQLNEAAIGIGVDGCGLPTYYIPLLAMARLYLQLITNSVFAPLKQAMIGFPHLVGGPSRIDTALMQVGDGQLLSKVGADGLICLAHLQKRQAFVLKLADGLVDIRDIVAVHYLKRLGWLSDAQWKDARLVSWREPYRKNTLGETIGRVVVLD